MNVWAIVVAAGLGSRFGSLKQYELLGERRVLDWSVTAARSVASGIVLAVPEARLAVPEPGVDAVVVGGSTRSASVRAALAVVPDDTDVVVVHDAARPLATPALFQAVVAAVVAGVAGGGVDGAVPALAVVDTLKQVRAGTVLATIDRAELMSVQTPQAFTAASLRRAYAGSSQATDDAALVEAIGGRIVVVPGNPANAKLTRPEDLEWARLVVSMAQQQ